MYKLTIKPSETLHTVFGTAKLNKFGYYIITSRKENNNGKLLHRLIWENNYGKISPKNYIHHIDGDKVNNCLWNLEPMDNSEHTRLHHKEFNHSNESCIKISRHHNTTGYFRVTKIKNNNISQGFQWRYQYRENGKNKKIARVNLDDLEEEVKNRGLEWRVL